MVYRSKLMPSREVLRWLYGDRRLSDEQIGELCGGVSPQTVARWRQKLDVHRPRAVAAVSKAVLEDLYVAQRLTVKQVAEKTGLSAWTAHQLLRHYRIPIRPPGRTQGSRRLPPERLPDDQVLARVYDSGHTLTEMASQYGVSIPTIRDRVTAGGGHIRRRGPRMPRTRAWARRPIVVLDGAVLPGRGTTR